MTDKSIQSGRIYAELLGNIPDGVTLSRKERQLVLKNIADLWVINPKIARELEDGVFILIGRLAGNEPR